MDNEENKKSNKDILKNAFKTSFLLLLGVCLAHFAFGYILGFFDGLS